MISGIGPEETEVDSILSGFRLINEIMKANRNLKTLL
jgi:hypothetical protein